MSTSQAVAENIDEITQSMVMAVTQADSAFAAGIIYGLLNKLGGQETVGFAAAAGALQQTIEGDFSRVSVEEVQRLAGGDSSGRVLR